MARYTRVFLITAALILLQGCDQKSRSDKPTPTTTSNADVPTVSVRFAGLPYGDHSFAAIGIEKGFFKDVGIDLTYKTIKIDDIVSSLANGAYDIASIPPGMLFASHETTPEILTFVFSDLFQGYALMAASDKNLRSYTEFRKDGLDHDAAVAATVAQMKGKTFAYPTENAIKPFIDLLLTKGHLGPDDFKPLVLDDPLTVNAMRKGQADFQVGGVPSRITLQKEGFIPLISSVDLASGAKPSPTSKELASILQNGWATTKTFYDKQHATVLRLASVNYRIMRFMETHRDEAIQIHMAYLTRVTGEQFTPADGEVIYDSLDPFLTFEKQNVWFHDPASPFYYGNINGAILASFVADNIYKKTPPTVDDVIFADDIYRELEGLRKDAESALEAAQKREPEMTANEKQRLKVAEQQFDAYNYYDAARLAKQLGGS